VIRSVAALLLTAATAGDPPAWTRPTAPFPIIGPIHYVGTEGLAAYLIRTREGAILIDGTMAENVPAIRRNIAAAGVPIGQVRRILLTHAHFDHAAGIAGLQRASGARLVVGAGDAEAMRTGVPPGETSYGVIRFPPARVDGVIRDGETVTLGGVTLTAHATPGHTPGCTSWTMRVVDRGRPLRVLFPCSLTVAGNRLIGNRRYPGIVADFRRSLAAMARVGADVVLPAHPEQADVIARGRRSAAGERDAFVAPDLWPKLVREAAAAFEAELAKQQAAVR
jgi:glyoxylase-like metal-dependent hydrolase (beta-lactamase superfamily II)